jgi:DNA-directed RNA polymerase subunit M/transcription elongation factor TFIIS
MIWLKACPKCRGDLVLDSDYYGNYVSCIQCGHSLEQSQQSQLQQRLFTTKQTAELKEMMSSSSRVIEERVA